MWTQKPTSSCSRGQSARRPRLRGVHDSASSAVSNRPMPWTIAQKRAASSRSNISAEMPRWPGGWLAGSSQTSLPGCPSSVDSSDQVAPLVAALEDAGRLDADEHAAVLDREGRDLRDLAAGVVVVRDALARVRPRLAEVGAAPDGRAVPLARGGRVDRARARRRGRRGTPASPRRTGRASSSRAGRRRSPAGSSPCGCRRAAASLASVLTSASRSGRSIRPRRRAKVIGSSVEIVPPGWTTRIVPVPPASTT